MTDLLTAHQRLSLRRRFPALEIRQRSVSEVRFVLPTGSLLARRPPFSTWRVEWMGGGGAELEALRTALIGIFETRR